MEPWSWRRGKAKQASENCELVAAKWRWERRRGKGREEEEDEEKWHQRD
jgi:hypothetical protein